MGVHVILPVDNRSLESLFHSDIIYLQFEEDDMVQGILMYRI